MLVRKKYVVQKSFRIDEDVERDLGILAQLTERSQNDLVNVAIMELLQDNKHYFLNEAIYEHFSRQIENADGILEPFEMGDLTVEVEYFAGGIKVRSIIKDGDEVLEDYTREFEFENDEFESYLKELSVHINMSAEDTKRYLEGRVDYRDYIKIRN